MVKDNSKSIEDIWVKFENSLFNKGLCQQRIKKLHTDYGIMRRRIFPNKDLYAVTRQDMEKFITALSRNEFKSETGKNYSGNTKIDIKRFLKQFWKWLKGNDEYFPQEVSWIKTVMSKDEHKGKEDILTYSEVVKFSESFSKPEYRILILLLFDSGFRISEMLSVRKKDLEWKEYDKGKNCFWIKCQKSKTYVREVPIPLFTEEINNYINTAGIREKLDTDLLFNLRYGAVNKCVRESGIRVLKRRIHPHLLRHSSATYYAKLWNGDRNKLSQKFGWTYGSDQLETYIRLSQNSLKEGVKEIYKNEVSEIKEKVVVENQELKKELEDIKKKLEMKDYEHNWDDEFREIEEAVYMSKDNRKMTEQEKKDLVDKHYIEYFERNYNNNNLSKMDVGEYIRENIPYCKSYKTRWERIQISRGILKGLS